MSSIWEDLEKASVKGNRDKLGEGRGVIELKGVKVKRSENPKQKGQLIMVVEQLVVRHEDQEMVDKDKSFTINLSNEFSMGEAKALIAAALNIPTPTAARMQEAVEKGELVGKRVRINRIEATAKESGFKYFQNFFDPYEGSGASNRPAAWSPPEGWFPHPDRAGTYYNAAGELKTRDQLTAAA